MAFKFKKGEKVIVMKGKSKGKSGVIDKVLPKQNKVLISDVNYLVHYVKPNQENPRGAMIRKEAPVDASNVMHLDPRIDLPTRVGYKTNEAGQKVKYSKKSQEAIVV